MNTETAGSDAETSTENDSANLLAEKAATAQLEVLAVDNWLVFDCPNCQQTIKIDRKDSVHAIECPSCGREFDPLTTRAREARKSVIEGHSARRRTAASIRRRMKDDLNGRPSVQTLPDQGRVSLSVTARTAKSDAESNAVSKPAALPLRSSTGLAERILEATNKPLHPTEDGERLIEQEIAAVSGGDYKRLRVRTRVKKQTEEQWKLRFWMLCALGAVGVSALGLAAAKVIQNRHLASEAAGVEGTTDARGPRIKTWNELVERLREAKTAGDLLPLIRKPTQLEPRLREAYPDGFPRMEVRQAAAKTGVDLPPGFQRVDIVLPNQLLNLYLEQSKAFGWRLDWESFSGDVIPWKRFVESKPTEITRLRAIASRGDLWQGDFTDKAKLLCVRLEDASHKQSVYAYGPQFSVVTNKLEKLLLKHAQEREQEGRAIDELRVIVDLRFPNNAKNNTQAELVQLVRDDWVIP